jgi:hypothetical protein
VNIKEKIGGEEWKQRKRGDRGEWGRRWWRRKVKVQTTLLYPSSDNCIIRKTFGRVLSFLWVGFKALRRWVGCTWI